MVYFREEKALLSEKHSPSIATQNSNYCGMGMSKIQSQCEAMSTGSHPEVVLDLLLS